ncbi:MAG: SLC13 family permease [Deltaproteobacteria bacterium]|nr:MAG: SLC13 family permease [Deltaproteobacteria bacterium]
MTLAALLTLLVVVAALICIMLQVASPDLVLLGAVVLLLLAGVLSPAEALSGFSNGGMLTVAALFVVAAGLRETGAVTILTSGLLGRPRNERGAIARLAAPVVAASAFLNNTMVVATLLPGVTDWARGIGRAPSRFLLPLSFASILGGLCTLLGTSTNLVVAGLVDDMISDHPDLSPIGMFDIAPVGLPIAGVGLLFLVVAAPWLLPERRSAVSRDDDPRHYTMEVLVPQGSRLAGKTIEAAGLRNQPGAFLMEVIRDDTVLPVVDAQQLLNEGDRLIFVGDVGAVVDLQRMPGLAAAPDQVFKLEGERGRRQIVEAVVSQRNPLVGWSIRDGGFRRRYHAVVIAVARAGERLPGRIGDIVLRTGDVLLLEAHPQFVKEQRTRTDFYLVSQVPGAAPPRTERALLSVAILGALVVTATLGLLPIVTAAFAGAGLMLLTRCCTIGEARRSLDLQVLFAIAAALGLGRAMIDSGLAQNLADTAVWIGGGHPYLALVTVYVLTVVLTEAVTNNAAAVLTLPVAVAMAEQVGAAPMGFVFAVMVAASASFLTPIGYQTNLMVMGPGGYRPLDYPRLGLPLSLLVAVTAMAIIPWVWPLS